MSSVGFYEAVGSGTSGSRGSLIDDGGDEVRSVSAGVPAREEGRRIRIFDHVVEQERLFASIVGHNRRQGRG